MEQDNNEDVFKDIRYVLLFVTTIIMLLLAVTTCSEVEYETQNNKDAMSQCQDFCALGDKQVRIYDDGVCICRDNKK